ncbi:LOW QUALITY PROTEIN: hypothetical protein OSB04_018395 [Centaurea solstitialis]|uniref:F-box domain-containing protein n=1 Tax=Centaurea solstitialis TaxID=347529 RepID=A0AA38TGK5_9ASTR|nr:LOW QUALITY PROTEIN: hypothetical protein OSB04_018395 [Centaurea solstitialis]
MHQTNWVGRHLQYLVKAESQRADSSTYQEEERTTTKNYINTSSTLCLISHTKMAPTKHRTTIQSLPDDVLSKILIRLPAKPLARMRCVSKPMYAFLSQPSFIKSHLHRSIHNTDDEVFLIFNDGLCSNYPFSVTAHFSRSPRRVVDNFIKMPSSIPQSAYDTVKILGSVNGLICFSFEPENDFVIQIWNPSLSAVSTLPPFHDHARFLSDYDNFQMHFRFGYDPKTDDYKLVKLTNRYKKQPDLFCFTIFAFDLRSFVNDVGKIPEVEVYSMRKGSWKSLQDHSFPRHVSGIIDENVVSVDGHDGFIHWLGYMNTVTQQTIVAFDLGRETFSEIRLPDSFPNDDPRRYMNGLGVLGGKLCVMAFNQYFDCEIWVMKEYGVPKSWVKSNILSAHSTNAHYFPFGFTLNNVFLFARSFGVLALLDPVRAKIESFKVIPRFQTKIVQYVDSLVWVAANYKKNPVEDALKFRLQILEVYVALISFHKILCSPSQREHRRPTMAAPLLLPTTIEKLPDHLLSNILVRVLARTLAQMRSVSKPLNALLFQPSFIESHLHRSIETNVEILLVFKHLYSSEVSAHPSTSPHLELPNFIDQLPLCDDVFNDYVGHELIGAVNGLICLYYLEDDFTIQIWNPSISARLDLPPPRTDDYENNFRFAFDPYNDDYKVVKLAAINFVKVEYEKGFLGNYYRKVSFASFHIRWRQSLGDGHDGRLHWLCFHADDHDLETIVAFDLGAERMSEIGLPVDNIGRNNVLGVLGGKLCLMSCLRDHECEVWLMNEYRNAESWAKHHVFSQFSANNMSPFGFTLSNEFLFASFDVLSMYDPIATKVKSFMLGLMPNLFPIYVDSLVWITPDKRKKKRKRCSGKEGGSNENDIFLREYENDS